MGYQRKFHNATGIRHLETLLHWTLSASSPLCSVSGVDCPSVDPRQLPLLVSCDQLPTAGLHWVASSTLVRGSPYHFRIRRDFMSKNPLSGFAPKQTRLLWRPTPIVATPLQTAKTHLAQKCILGIYTKFRLIVRFLFGVSG